MRATQSLDDLKPGRFYTLAELARASGIPASSMRAAFARGDLVGMRTRPSCNAPVRIMAKDFFLWLERCAAFRRVISPAESAEINRQVRSD
jgi:hypothetical protein